MTNKLLALIVDDEPAAREILRTHLQGIECPATVMPLIVQLLQANCLN